MAEIYVLLMALGGLLCAILAHLRIGNIEEDEASNLDFYSQQVVDLNSRVYYLETLLKEEKINYDNTTTKNIATIGQVRRQVKRQKGDGGSKVSKT